MQELASSYTGDPALYFYGVARNVHLEHVRRNPVIPPPPAPDPPEQKELEYRCLEACMAALAPENRQLMVEYYKEERHAKIVHRKELAARMGIALNALRIRAYRTRAALQVCVENCIQKGLR
jgi:DNA-directed RNA polymerase specialized sigma24 family protein